MSAHEESAVELAVQIAAATGGAATVLTLGDADAVEQLRAALAVGCTAAVHVVADPQTFGPADVAREIAAVVATGERYDLVLLGNDAADSGDFQVGIRLAYELGRPGGQRRRPTCRSPAARGDRERGRPDGQETYRVPLPAVVTVLEGGVEPRYPSVPGRMKAKKIAIEERPPTAEPAGPARVRLLLPPPAPSNVDMLGKGADAAPAVVDLLERLGVLAR